MGDNGDSTVDFVASQEDLRRCSVCFEKLREDRRGGVCHHCGKLLCDFRSEDVWHMNAPEQSLEFAGKQAGSILVRLGIFKPPKDGIAGLDDPRGRHCREHYHTLVSSMKAILLGLVLFVLGIVLAIALENGYPLFATLLGALILGPAIALHIKRFIHPQHRLDAAPLNPNGLGVHVTEEMRGDFVVSRESFDESPEYLRGVSGAGSVSVVADFRELDRDALQDFAEREGRDPEHIDWHIGYFSLDDSRNIRFKGEAPGVGNVTPLVVKAGSGRKKMEEYVRGGTEELLSLPYEIDLEGGIRKPVVTDEDGTPKGFVPFSRFPVHIIPLLDESGRVFGLAMSAIAFDVLQANRVTCRITLNVPGDLNVDRVGETKVMTGRFDPTQGQIMWNGDRRREDIKDEDEELWPHTEVVWVNFRENVLTNLTSHPVLEGSYELVLHGVALSGIGVDDRCLFLPTGGPRGEVGVARRTVISGKLSIDLGVLSYPYEHTASHELSLGNLIPDHHTMQRLSEVVRAKGVYVAKVTDNPPVIDAKSANVRHRSWDEIARIYAGGGALFGVDIHAVLSGHEEYTGSTLPSIGAGKLELTVRGMVHDDATRAIVDATRDEISAAVSESFSGYSHPLVAASTAARARVDASAGAASAEDERQKLEARIEKLEDALLEGKITDERYEKMKAEIQQKISDLGS